ncbi:MAG: 50S ribosomal protein L22 [Firmicutes bacterium]|nr:50S ribosomal protein L22 [Bacillota bacterium]
MQAKAEAKHIRISPRKMKPIADLVRGKNVKDAQNILKFTPRKGAEIFLKVLNSAIANAENNFHMDVDTLIVKDIYANQGPTLKRWNAGSMGRANPVLRRSSHVGVIVADKE